MKKILSFSIILCAMIALFPNLANAKNNKEFVIVIHAGHGGTDAGAQAIDGTKEKDLTLAYALELQKIARENNFTVVLCREDDTNFDLDQRAEFSKNQNADVFLSLHFNTDPNNANQNGIECNVADKNLAIENKMLGKFIGAELYSIQDIKFKGVNVDVARSKTLNDFASPAALLELGYLSNEKDLSFIKSEAGKTQICQKLLQAIIRYKTQMDSK